MTHSNTKSTVASWLNPLCLLFVTAALISGCGGLRKEKEPEYKQAKSSNPLEIPPDLTAIPANPSTSIPTASGEPINDSQTAEQKFKKWKAFEEFEKWKRESGDEQAEFEAYRKFKQQDTGGRDPSISELNTSTGDNAYAAIEAGENGNLRLRINDNKDDAWTRIEEGIKNTGSHLQRKKRSKGFMIVVPAKYWNTSGAGQKLAALVKKPKHRLEVVVAKTNNILQLEVTPVAGTNQEDANELVRRLHRVLNAKNSDSAS